MSTLDPSTTARLAVLDAKRPHIELYRSSMEQRNLAPSTIDRRLWTVCGFYRFAHIDGRSPPIPPSTCADPRFISLRAEGSIARSSGPSSTPLNDSIRTMPLWRCCWDSTA